jgi:hypothetical protein
MKSLVCNFPICLFTNGNPRLCRNLTSHNSVAASQVTIASEGQSLHVIPRPCWDKAIYEACSGVALKAPFPREIYLKIEP